MTVYNTHQTLNLYNCWDSRQWWKCKWPDSTLNYLLCACCPCLHPSVVLDIYIIQPWQWHKPRNRLLVQFLHFSHYYQKCSLPVKEAVNYANFIKGQIILLHFYIIFSLRLNTINVYWCYRLLFVMNYNVCLGKTSWLVFQSIWTVKWVRNYSHMFVS